MLQRRLETWTLGAPGDIEIVLGPATTVTGTAADARGRPVADAGIVAFAEDASLWQLPGSRYMRRLAASADGRFTIDGLPAGRYDIVAFESDGDMPSNNHVLGEHTARSMRFTIAAGAQQSILSRLSSRRGAEPIR